MVHINLWYTLMLLMVLSGRVHSMKKKTLVGASKEIGLEVNADKIKYMVMSRD